MPMTKEQYDHQQRMAIIQKRFTYIKAELHQSMNIASLRDRVRELTELLEYHLLGSLQPETNGQSPIL